MIVTLSTRGRLGAVLSLGLLAAACTSEAPFTALPAVSSLGAGGLAASGGGWVYDGGNGGVAPNQGQICKYGSSATIEVTIQYVGGGSTTNTYDLSDGECRIVYEYWAVPGDSMFATEIGAPAGYSLTSIETTQYYQATIGAPIEITTTTQSSGTAKGLVGIKSGATFKFYNAATPMGYDGCTPGYWKQTQHFDSWTAPYTPSTQFGSVFADAFPGMTLLQVLSQGGGGLNALGRHTVAALLNTASAGVDYPVTTADVIAAFNAAYASGDYETQKNIFAGYNELGCPLN